MGTFACFLLTPFMARLIFLASARLHFWNGVHFAIADNRMEMTGSTASTWLQIRWLVYVGLQSFAFGRNAVGLLVTMKAICIETVSHCSVNVLDCRGDSLSPVHLGWEGWWYECSIFMQCLYLASLCGKVLFIRHLCGMSLSLSVPLEAPHGLLSSYPSCFHPSHSLSSRQCVQRCYFPSHLRPLSAPVSILCFLTLLAGICRVIENNVRTVKVMLH